MIGWGNLNLEGHGVDCVNVVVGVTLGEDGDVVAALHDVRPQDLGCFHLWNTVVIDTDLNDVVAAAHVAGNPDESGTKVGGPSVAWQV